MLLKLGPGRQRSRRSKNLRSKNRSLSLLMLALPFVFWISYEHIKGYFLQPQAVMVLGGDPERERFAAELARQHADQPIWVSTGSNPEYAEWVFSEAGIDPSRLHLDYRAVDTVTNFTTLVDKLQAQGITSIYLITSDDHMRRAQIIGEIVLGSRDIDIKPVPVPSGRSPEPLEKSIRDGARAILWVTTGRTGSTLNRRILEGH